MNSDEIRQRFLDFFAKRGHTVIASASLVTADEKGLEKSLTNPTLFNTAGMQPLIPYLLGEPYVLDDGREVKRLADVQKCLRTVDIDDVGDKTHATFFEMLGNWSLGGPPEGYSKKEAIAWSYEFLTSTSDEPGNRGLGLDPRRLYVTVFEGDANAPRDDEAADIWREIFKKAGVEVGKESEATRIFYMPADMNWWQAGDNGPCGPDTEMYYDIGVMSANEKEVGEREAKFGGKGITREQFIAADAVRDVVEVWNDVFMQYEKKDGKIIGRLAKPSVDTGAGLERLAMTLQGVDNIYDTDLLKPVMDRIKKLSGNFNIKSARIVTDHIKAAVMLIADGVTPSNTDRGYVLRKLVRRAVRHSDILAIPGILSEAVPFIQDQYQKIYPNVMSDDNGSGIQATIRAEELKFRETLKHGLAEFEKISTKNISAYDAFALFSSYGFPLELTVELAKEKGNTVDIKGFDEEFKRHQSLSRTGAEKKFKGGLADASDPVVIRYHTATHLLHQALHDVLGEGVSQKGSNITPERLRFDFSHGTKMTDDEKKHVEDIVNEKIASALPVQQIIMPKAEAEKTGAQHFFADKYGDEVSIYFVGNDLATAYSKEFCGGPHVINTRELAGENGEARFKILKEEAVSQGVRRIKAVLQ